MQWFIDLYSAAGNKIGSGPIASARRWQSTARMDRAGTFAFEMSCADAQAPLVAPLTTVRCYALVDGAVTEVGAGLVESIATEIGADGEVTLAVSGSDLLAELALRIMGPEYLDGSATITPPMTPVTHATALAFIENVASTTGWTMTPDPAPPVDSLVGRWNYESVLQALVSLALKCESHFYISGYQQLTFASTFSDSGVRAVAASGDLGSGVAAITQLRRVEDAADLITTVVPFGAGNADARLTAKPSSRVAGAGYSSPTSGTYYRLIRGVTSEALYGQRMRVVVFNDITPISSTDADVEAAANALWDAAFYYLRQHEYPAEFYSVELAQCPVLLRPMQTIRVVWRDVAQNVSIDESLNILEATTTLDAEGLRTTKLTVATVDRYPESDTNAAVSRLAQGQMYEAAPQLNANSYVISYAKPVDETETATFRFRFDSEVVQLTRLTFDFQLLPLESTVKSIAGAASTTAAGGATTSSSGGSSTPTTSSGGATTSSSGGSSTPTTSSGGGTTVTSDSGSGHTHEINVADSTSGSAVYFAGTGSPATGDLRTSGGGRINTSSTGSGHTHSVTIGSHIHSVTIGDHTHTIGNHTHTVTIGDHTHTIGTHTHDYTPVLTAAYGIFRDSAGNTFALADLEYSVDGSTWYGFSVGVNGFTSLGDGWYRVDLTALLQNSSTLRPTANNNAVRVRRKSTGATKKAMIEAQINVRTIIQAIAAL